MLPSAAPTPPCAATVCERVGKTFESTATLSPAVASSRDARIPEPPAPTITASNLRTGRAMASAAPENRGGPDEIEEEREADRHLQREAQPRGADVVHQDVAHADPRVVEQRREEQHRRQ